MHYWWGKCLTLKKNFTRTTFSLSLMLCFCLSLIIFSFVPRAESMHSASWGELTEFLQEKKKNRAWLWHAKNLCGIVFIMEQSTENARARNMIQQYQLKSKFRSLNSTMSHKVIKYLKYILWLTGYWQSLKHIALPFDRAVDGNAIKLLSDFIQHHWKWNMRRRNMLLYNNQP